MITISNVSEQIRDRCFAFLDKHEDSAQFLISNLRELGPRLTSHHNSGNFKAIESDGEIRGVFCLTRRGNLIAQTEIDCSAQILEALQSEPIELKGFIGAWPSIEPILTAFREAHPAYRPTYESKEILYSYLLTPGDKNLRYDTRVRFLEARDFSQWLAFGKDYLSELSLPDELSDEERHTDFTRQIQNQIWWGLFDGEILLSRVALNSKSESVGQVGGVYTPPIQRRKGLAKATMSHMLKDCRDLHRHRKSILFTGETDLAAQRLYESMGYQRIGAFALILS